MKKKYLFILIYMTLFLNYIISVDLDFGTFQYKGSRLKRIIWWGVKSTTKVLGKEKINKQLADNAFYRYDENGYLIERKLGGSTSKITYDLKNNIVYEYVDRITGFDKPMPIYLEYYYDMNNRLINYKRKDSNIYNDKIDLDRDVYIEYNEKGDLTAIYDKMEVTTDAIYFPGEDITNGDDAYFEYEYKENMTIRYEKRKNLLYDAEFYYDIQRLIKVMIYAGGKENLMYTTTLKYDNNGNIIETVLTYPAETKRPEYTQTYRYEYDEQNRLIKKYIYYDSLHTGRLEQIEEYEYEDGPYVHFPYLLPTAKIRIYHPHHGDAGIDRNMF